MELEDDQPATPAEALAELLAGNERFVTGSLIHPHQNAEHRTVVANGQRPFAVVFGCSDSRLAAEIIFDRGLGDLFVVRTAGHVIGPEVLGSIEYGVSVLGTPLVIVLGHDSCGAVGATREAVAAGASGEGFVRDVIERVTPSVLAANAAGYTENSDFIDEHIRHTVALLLDRSHTIAAAVAAGTTAVVGLSYRLVDGTAHLVTTRGLDLPAAA
ncbi:MAG TPA: carbonic anhydrase [Micromonosporaceae bacterium]|nr:carbonic anhydrase [Micromonosporaceae bacterium]